jgi:hypothetical protein
MGWLPACGGDDLPVDPGPGTDQPPLDTEPRTQPDMAWDSGLSARDIRWNYNTARSLTRSLSIVGSLRINFVNTNPIDSVAADMLIRFVGADGFQHVPETPLRRVAVPSLDTVEVRESFIVEMADTETANAVERMSITLF